MEVRERDIKMSEAGPSSPRSAAGPPQQNDTENRDPASLASQHRPTPPPPQPEASTSASSSHSSSRSPTSSRRGTKHSPSVSPVPEELPPRATSSTTQPATEDPSPPSKRSRPPSDPTTKRRGQRLFGLLNSTLTQFKAESESTRSTTAAQRRAEIEARLANKLKQTDSILSATERKKSLVWEARTLAEEIATGDAQRKTLRGMKRRMASFLFTPSTPSNSRTRRGGGEDARLAPEIPISTSARDVRRGDREGHALYFLPGKTLPEQEDKLNEQEDDVDEKIDRFDDGWDARRSELMGRLEDVNERIKKI